jgi:hypothetical protein
MCNEWAAMSINLPSACCRQPIYGLWPIIFTFVFQSCELHSAHQHNAKKQNAEILKQKPIAPKFSFAQCFEAGFSNSNIY